MDRIKRSFNHDKNKNNTNLIGRTKNENESNFVGQ